MGLGVVVLKSKQPGQGNARVPRPWRTYVGQRDYSYL